MWEGFWEYIHWQEIEENSTDTRHEYHSPSFLYTVKVDEEAWIIVKTPRSTLHTSAEHEKTWLNKHNQYMSNFIPDTDVVLTDTWFQLQQEYIDWKPVDLRTNMNPDVWKLIEAGQDLQAQERILFDVFGIEWMVRLFNYYFEKGDMLREINEAALPLNAQYLQMMHNFPPELLKQLNTENNKNPFIAYNIRETEDGRVYYTEANNRDLSVSRLTSKVNPLNRVWAWITRRAMQDLQELRQNNNNNR